MTIDQWMTLGIFTASVVFSVVGYLIVREIRTNDRRFEQLEKKLERADYDCSKMKNEVRVLKMILNHKGIFPNTIPFPSPPPGSEESE